MNTKLMRDFAAYMRAVNPDSFVMQFWGVNKKGETATCANLCGTAACIAGHFILYEGGSLDVYDRFTDRDGRLVRPQHYIAERMGLDIPLLCQLIYDYYIRTPEQAAQRLEEMAELGEAEAAQTEQELAQVECACRRR